MENLLYIVLLLFAGGFGFWISKRRGRKRAAARVPPIAPSATVSPPPVAPGTTATPATGQPGASPGTGTPTPTPAPPPAWRERWKKRLPWIGYGAALLAAGYLVWYLHGLMTGYPWYKELVSKDPRVIPAVLILLVFSIWMSRRGGFAFRDKLSTAAKALIAFGAVIVGGSLLAFVSPDDWWFIHKEVYVPVRGLVLSLFLALLWLFGEAQKEDGGLLMLAFFITVGLIVWGLSGNSYPMEELFSPRMERFPDLPYWTKLPGSLGKIKSWHILTATAALAALVTITAKNTAWGTILLGIPVFFLWNQLG